MHRSLSAPASNPPFITLRVAQEHCFRVAASSLVSLGKRSLLRFSCDPSGSNSRPRAKYLGNNYSGHLSLLSRLRGRFDQGRGDHCCCSGGTFYPPKG